MTPIERGLRAVDRAQQRTHTGAIAFGVVKKFGDDRGGALSALLTYYGFMALFPMLLVFATVLGFIGNARIGDSVLGAALAQFPVFGQQLGKDAAHPLHGSGLGLAFGLAWTLYGSLGVAQAAQHTMAQVWNVPGAVRPGFGPRLARGLLLFATLGIGVALTAAISGFATATGSTAPALRVAVLVAEAALNIGLWVVGFRILTPKSVPTRDLVAGGVVAGVGYTVLLTVGVALVQHQLRHAQAVYGQFGFVLGLISWLYLLAQLTIYAAELNVVRSRRLWPRSIVQPPLTAADERVLRDIARQEERRPDERIGVGFGRYAGRDAARDALKPR